MRLFYDGECGLCHLTVRLVLLADSSGAVRLAPLGGETFRALVPASDRSALPDSLVLRETGGALLTRSAAVVALLSHLGGPGRLLAAGAGAIPTPLADRLYDVVARVRGRLFRRPHATCPRVSPALLTRFDP